MDNLKKKAELSINVVIIAVICLLVLIVLVFIFSGRLKIFNTGTSECKGECITSGTWDSTTNTVKDPKTSQGTCGGPIMETGDTKCIEWGDSSIKDKKRYCCLTLI